MKMIMRIWHGVTLESDSEEYFNYLQETGVKMYKSIKGNLGVYVLRRIIDKKAEFYLLSLWESIESVKLYWGQEYEKANYCFPKDKDFLLELEPFVSHFDVLLKA
jgi:heme-degrading monooxygenase HmoA